LPFLQKREPKLKTGPKVRRKPPEKLRLIRWKKGTLRKRGEIGCVEPLKAGGK